MSKFKVFPERGPHVTPSVLKVSGRALAGLRHGAFDPISTRLATSIILPFVQSGFLKGIVIGGGNILRGSMAKDFGLGASDAHALGMSAADLNAKFLSALLRGAGITGARNVSSEEFRQHRRANSLSELSDECYNGAVLVMSGGIGDLGNTTDYGAVVAAEALNAKAIIFAKDGVDGVYSADPRLHPKAIKIEELTPQAYLDSGYSVIEPAAVKYAAELSIVLHVIKYGDLSAVTEHLAGNRPGSIIQESSK